MMQENNLQTIFQKHQGLSLVVQVVGLIRPRHFDDGETATQNLECFCDWLSKHDEERQLFAHTISDILRHANLQYIYCESGLLTGSGFFAELNRKIAYKFLPPLLQDNDLRVFIRSVFHRSSDYKWVNGIPDSGWLKLIRMVDLGEAWHQPNHTKDLLKAGDIISYRIANLGLDEQITAKADDIIEPVNAFVEQSEEWQRFKSIYEREDISDIDRFPLSRMLQSIDLGFRQIREIRRHKKVRGTGLQQTFILERLDQHFKRLQHIATLLDPKMDVSPQSFLRYFLQVVESENTQHKVRAFLSSTLSYLAYQISEHGSRTGEKYITSNQKEYWQFFSSAAIGGVIISIAAFLKVLLTHLQLPYFWASFSYGINYALAFVIIHFLKGTIATKQPALTASTVANALDSANPRSPSMYNLALLIGKVFRSQFASLLGNLIVVFPLTFLFALAFHAATGHFLIPEAEVPKMIQDVRLGVSNIWFAAVAGFLLFMSGIVSGYFDNKVIYADIPERLKKSGKLRKWFGDAKQTVIADYIDKNLGAIMGNIILGFGLGFMIFFGKILGLPLDIRHVTISTGFFGFITHTTAFQMFWQTTLWCVLGLVAIAFTNLLVSFALALYVAMKSRRVSTKQVWPLIKLSFRYFFRYPTDFVYPPRRERTAKEINNNQQAA